MTPTAQQVMEALREQVGCYRRLHKLALQQHEYVQQSQIEALLELLGQRQALLDQIAALEQVTGPVKKGWSAYAGGLDGATRASAEEMIAQARALLEQITAADKDDVMALQNRKLNLGREINQASAARKVNRNYASAAYGRQPSRMDIQS